MMRYILLIYSQSPGRDLSERDYSAHWAVMGEAEAARKGSVVAAEPLPPASAAKIVRNEQGKRLITDGPFAETKEQLAGFYIFDCETQDEALQWAERILPACSNAVAIEVRQMPGLPERAESQNAGTTVKR